MKHLLFLRELINQIPNDGGGGGGEGEGEGQGLTDEMRRQIGESVNQAVVAHMKRGNFRQLVSQAAAEAVTTAMPNITEQLVGTLKEQGVVGQQGGEGDGDGQGAGAGPGAGGYNIETDPKYQALLKRMEHQQQQFEAQNREREDERQQRMRAEERGALESKLREQGVPEKRIKPAAAYLFSELGVVGRSEDNSSIIWKAQRDGYVDELDVASGVKEWLKTDVGKEFLPATGARGTGARGTRGAPGIQNGAGDKPSKGDALDTLATALSGGFE